MNTMFEQIDIGVSQSLKIKKYQIPNLDIPYHHHPEIELVLVVRSTGKVFVRNTIKPFSPGDLFVFDANVPHLLINDEEFYNNTLNAEFIVIQIHTDLLKNNLLLLPEFNNIKHLLDRASHGIKFTDIRNSEAFNLIRSAYHKDGIYRLIDVIALLENLNSENDFELMDIISSTPQNLEQPERIQKINKFISQNYHEDISLEEVASIASMNKSSFCRYFKKYTRKTFSQYLNELRVDYASKLLIESSFTVTKICYDVGYNHVPYFIKKFTGIKGLSPKQYRTKYRQNV
ncbi:AraC family transcriptional regulator [Aquimarina sp. MMG016]|uniref:AraC family transcriptional regulator n=1 Tax=Aquimarina sp. MMG016 TaxID=2822690 RepID=UPI001B3A67E3|nr:AraC family transcriptional regulator [Aquimarina sp. MMG016]MBQ4821662.1 helix-turn-helix domain-containing protein [Aquimarina sp. MMG016]